MGSCGYASSIWWYDVTQERHVDELIASLPAFRREKALSYRFIRDRILSARAYVALRDMLRTVYGIDSDPQFSFLQHGKPVLTGFPDIHFNLSHCSDAVLCVVGDRPVGCDVEEIFPDLDMDLCRACLNESELLTVTSSDAPTVEFSRLWTMKEAYLKLTGAGLTDEVKEILSPAVLSGVSFSSEVHLGHGVVTSVALFR